MTEPLVFWIKAGYPSVKESGELPIWILPEHRFYRLVDEFGNDGILDMSRPLGLNGKVESLLEKAPGPETVHRDAWETALENWTPLVHVKDMVEACLETSNRIMGLFNAGRLNADPNMVLRDMVVLSFAPFMLDGRLLIVDIAPVLGCNADRPGDILRQYGRTLALGDLLRAKQVDECITRHSQWVEVAKASVKQAMNCAYTPKPIGITPPMSSEMVTVLADIVKEEAR